MKDKIPYREALPVKAGGFAMARTKKDSVFVVTLCAMRCPDYRLPKDQSKVSKFPNPHSPIRNRDGLSVFEAVEERNKGTDGLL